MSVVWALSGMTRAQFHQVPLRASLADFHGVRESRKSKMSVKITM